MLKAFYFVPDFVTEFALTVFAVRVKQFMLVFTHQLFSFLYTVHLQSFRTDFLHRILPVLSNGHCWD